MAKQKDLVAEFEDAYTAILLDAEQAAETTKTDAWHAMYQAFAEKTKNEALSIASGLDGIASECRAILVTTDTVKEFGDLKKRFAELRERIEAFKVSTIDPIKKPFDAANECIVQFQSRAASERDAGGMYAKDVEDKMADAIAAQAKIRWNEKVGSIQIVAASKPA